MMTSPKPNYRVTAASHRERPLPEGINKNRAIAREVAIASLISAGIDHGACFETRSCGPLLGMRSF
jgi:hypothetical protein